MIAIITGGRRACFFVSEPPDDAQYDIWPDPEPEKAPIVQLSITGDP